MLRTYLTILSGASIAVNSDRRHFCKADSLYSLRCREDVFSKNLAIKRRWHESTSCSSTLLDHLYTATSQGVGGYEGLRRAEELLWGGRPTYPLSLRVLLKPGSERDEQRSRSLRGRSGTKRDKGGIPIGASGTQRARAYFFLGRRARSSHGGLWRASERVSSCCVDRSSP